MTVLDEELEEAGFVTSLAGGDDEPTPPADQRPSDAPVVDDALVDVPLRPFIVAACSCAGAALTIGGIFGSWPARLLCLVAALGGVGWAWMTARSPKRRALLQGALPVVALLAAMLSLTAGAPGGPAQLPHLVREAIKSGHLLRPPIPFDAGWRPILIVLLMLLGYTAGIAGSILGRPRLALVIPLPLLAITAISQPKDGQAVAGLLAVLPVIAGLAVLFGAERGGVTQLSREFELRRAIKAVSYVGVVLVAIIVLNNASFLFPTPTYDPSQKPQKPKAVPLSKVEDRVLFEVSGPITGPWKVGSLDEYDGESWKLPPYEPKKLRRLPADGTVDDTRKGTNKVTFTVRKLGTSATLPGVTGPTRIVADGRKLLFDDRAGTARVPSGRVPEGLHYDELVPPYPTPEQLHAASPGSGVDRLYLRIPKAPRAVRDLLDVAPKDPWDRLDFLLKKLTAVEIASGEGTPADVTPATVQRILAGNHEGSPFELVAAQAMLARWAGVPARIGFGFDGVQKEGGVNTVRPRNAAQWLEVHFDRYGWVPIVTQPPKAKASLDNDKNVKFNPSIEAGSDIAVQVYIPVKVPSLVLLYQRVRSFLVTVLPLLLALALLYLATPWMQKTWRTAKRRRWAAENGPGAQIAVEYCEVRDLATDLGVGDPYATPIEFLDFVVEDDEHQELAWLVSDALYGELQGRCTDVEVSAARELSASLRSRLLKGHPLQTRVLSLVTKLSLEQPYSTEVPAVQPLRLRARLPRRLRLVRRSA
ncbi:MAG: hypothetical protein QOD30_578 [Actinomycetota bacterium]|nr:hypothetical protein [Actinomycetota bacterium]